MFCESHEDGHDVFDDLGGGEEGGDAGQLLGQGLHYEKVAAIHQTRQALHHLDHLRLFQVAT